MRLPPSASADLTEKREVLQADEVSGGDRKRLLVKVLGRTQLALQVAHHSVNTVHALWLTKWLVSAAGGA